MTRRLVVLLGALMAASPLRGVLAHVGVGVLFGSLVVSATMPLRVLASPQAWVVPVLALAVSVWALWPVFVVMRRPAR